MLLLSLLRRHARRLLLCAACMGGLALLAGCSTISPTPAGVGALSATYRLGELTAAYTSTPPKLEKAAVKALATLQIVVASHQATAVDAQVLARTALEKDVTIKVLQEGTATSRISIRIGVVGDEYLSRRILAEIEKNL